MTTERERQLHMQQSQTHTGANDSEIGAESSDEDILALSPAARDALTSFHNDQDAARNALLSLSIQSHPMSHAPRLDVPYLPKVTIDEFKKAFKEDWQLSQFWYSRDTAERLTQALNGVCTVNDRVAFLCCPTGYTAFKEKGTVVSDLFLFEHDERFKILAGDKFIPYDLENPLSFPNVETLQGSIDVIVVDPPFHSESSQQKVASTVAHLLRPGGLLVLLTGLALSPLINAIYPSPPLPNLLFRADFNIEHDGVGRLETPYGFWVGGGNEENLRTFGEISGGSS